MAEPQEWSVLLKHQQQLEEIGMAEGALRFRDRLDKSEQQGAGSATGAARTLLQSRLAALECRIKDYCETQHPTGSVKWMKAIGPQVAAYMTLKVALDSTAGGSPGALGKMARTLADLILDELRYRRFKEKAPALFQYKLDSFNTAHVRHKAKSLNASMRFAAIDTSDLDLPVSKRLRLGAELICLLCETTGWYDCGHLSPTDRTEHVKTVLVMNEGTRKALANGNEMLELLSPIVGPMVVPPLPWSADQRGGYRFALRNKFPLVRKVSKAHQRRLAEADMPVVYTAVNRLQNTAWRINTRVLAVVNEIVSLGGGIAGLPLGEDEPLPEKPADIDTNEAARIAWRKAAHAVKNRHHARSMAVGEMQRVLSVAETAKHWQAIYFPHSLDFRGRIYPIASYLTPQGSDLSRALLLFANGKPVDEQAARWLAIHGANCYGVSPDGQRMSQWTFDQRVQWVEENAQLILEVAADPVLTFWWVRAKDPLKFLAFCIEWSGYLQAKQRGETFVSCLPVYQDGTCNGLQHFAALLRDERGGRAVNLVSQPAPQDIYQDVAEAVLKKLSELATVEPLAAQWLSLHERTGLVDRGLTKRPVMTFPYGSRQWGFKKQLLEYLRGLGNFPEIEAHFTVNGKDSPQIGLACVFMAKVIAASLREVAVAASEGMAWLQRMTKGPTKENRCTGWTVPLTGFPVRQEYFDQKMRCVATTLAGHAVYPTFAIATQKVDGHKQRNSISPNVVHSLDSATTMLTAAMSAEAGVGPLAAIHDSFGSLAADASTLAVVLRKAFTKLHAHDITADLHKQFGLQWQYPAKCPSPPPKGTLDVSQVLTSPYFFS